jgi:hypothetical protein
LSASLSIGSAERKIFLLDFPQINSAVNYFLFFFESIRIKPEIPQIPKKSGPDNLHVERKKFAPREDESFL